MVLEFMFKLSIDFVKFLFGKTFSQEQKDRVLVATFRVGNAYFENKMSHRKCEHIECMLLYVIRQNLESTPVESSGPIGRRNSGPFSFLFWGLG